MLLADSKGDEDTREGTPVNHSSSSASLESNEAMRLAVPAFLDAQLVEELLVETARIEGARVEGRIEEGEGVGSAEGSDGLFEVVVVVAA